MDRKQKDRIRKRLRVMRGVRRRVRGCAVKPRLSVFRSNKNLACQAIDDEVGVTLAAISSLEGGFQNDVQGCKTERAKVLGEEMARRLKEKGIERVAFDRGWYKYHGRIKAFADAVRKGGIKF
jgi:large subunit ribosomal protein L18